VTCFAHRFLPHRPGFPATITAAETEVMHEHVAYWQVLLDKGMAVAVDPVADPVVPDGLGTIEVFPMPGAIVRPLPGE
jgi:hypothetical protein